MAKRVDRIEARIAPDRAERIRRAAELSNQSVSAFVVDAASQRADELLIQQSETVVPAEYFDELLASLDEPAIAPPKLASAAKRARGLVEPR